MSPGMKIPTNRSTVQRPARGFVLIASLLIMVVLTIIVVTMFRGFGLQERIAGNVREKQRAFQAAQSAVNFAEWWLIQGNNAALTGNCTKLLTAPTQAVVCNAPLAKYTDVPWKSGGTDVGVAYTPPNMTVASSGVDTFYAAPRFYIVALGASPDGQSQLYQISGMGYGGNANALSVVQTTFAVTSGVKNLGGL